MAGGGGTFGFGIDFFAAATTGFLGGAGTAERDGVAGTLFATEGALANLGGLAFGRLRGAGGAATRFAEEGAAGGGGIRRPEATGTAAFRAARTGAGAFGAGRRALFIGGSAFGGGGAFTVGRAGGGLSLGIEGLGGTTVLRAGGAAAARWLGADVRAVLGDAARAGNPLGKVILDFSGCDGGGNKPPLLVGISGVRPERNIPGKVGSGPSLSRTLRSTITLGRLEPVGKTYSCCCATAGATIHNNAAMAKPKRHDCIPRHRPKFRTRFSKMDAYPITLFIARCALLIAFDHNSGLNGAQLFVPCFRAT